MTELFPNIKQSTRNYIRFFIMLASVANTPAEAIAIFENLWKTLTPEEQDYACFVLKTVKEKSKNSEKDSAN